MHPRLVTIPTKSSLETFDWYRSTTTINVIGLGSWWAFFDTHADSVSYSHSCWYSNANGHSTPTATPTPLPTATHTSTNQCPWALLMVATIVRPAVAPVNHGLPSEVLTANPPDLYQITAGKTDARLYFAPASDPYDRYRSLMADRQKLWVWLRVFAVPSW